MKTKIPYLSRKEAIKGYTNSSIASNESNDCVVRAFASAFDITYDESHTFCKNFFQRENGKGVHLFENKVDSLFSSPKRINNKIIIPIGEKGPFGYRLYYINKTKGVTYKKSYTVGRFITKYSKGTYLINVRGHVFTLKDGKVIGNPEDATKLKRIIISSWKILL